MRRRAPCALEPVYVDLRRGGLTSTGSLPEKKRSWRGCAASPASISRDTGG